MEKKTNHRVASLRGREKKTAFTLAEVLITLGIIGVVAAMTLPNLIANYQTRVIVTQLKKCYSIFSQAYQFAVNANGEIENWDIDAPDASDGAIKLYEYFKPYLGKVQDCGRTDGCFKNNYKSLFGPDFRVQPNTWRVYATARLSDGTPIAFWSGGSGCNLNHSKSNSGSLTRVCGIINFDVNGDKKPNRAGVDYLAFVITKDGLIPSGTSDFQDGTDRKCLYNDKADDNGLACTAWLMINENMDYLKHQISWD